MIIRIVKMHFRAEEVENFRQLFEDRKSMIRDFSGCRHLELWQDNKEPGIFFTYSWWESEAALNAYRDSSFFDDTWALTKQKFAAKPEAWSVHRATD